MTGKTFLLPS